MEKTNFIAYSPNKVDPLSGITLDMLKTCLTLPY